MDRHPGTSASFSEPPPLAAGARVALLAPAGPMADARDTESAMANALALGWDPHLSGNALRTTGYFAGTDAERVADLARAIADPAVDGIWCLRGGYGAMRLLPQLDTLPVAAFRKTLIGFSDITALHALWQRSGVVSYHGPTARAQLSAFSRQSLLQAVCERSNPASSLPAGDGPGPECLVPGEATGRLAGGNVALLAALAGTPWAVSFDGAIAVLEDVGEATYRLDRMFTQLRLAGAFTGCRGLLAGQCTDCPDSSADGTRSWRDLVYELGTALRVPTLVGAPIGHIAEQWTLPLGATATLDASGATLTVHRLQS